MAEQVRASGPLPQSCGKLGQKAMHVLAWDPAWLLRGMVGQARQCDSQMMSTRIVTYLLTASVFLAVLKIGYCPSA